jgi:uncharacterized SAM-binding protein YcdF (DUF218 family)
VVLEITPYIIILIIILYLYVPLAGSLTLMKERERALVPTLAQCGLGTSHTPVSFFANLCRSPHDVFSSPKS